MNIDKIIEMLSDNDFYNIEAYFGDVSNAFKLIDKRGRIEELDPKDGYDHWQNAYLLYLLQNKPEIFKEKITDILQDIDFVGDQVVFRTSTKSDLAKLFCDTRNQNRDTVSNILDQELDFDWFDNSTDDVYTDVIEELTPKNLNRLYERMIYELKDVRVDPGTELLELISGEQNHPEFVVVNMDNISRIVDDEESTNYLLDEYLSDLRSDLYQVHSNATHSAYNEEVYDEVMSELDRYFISPGRFTTVPHPYKKNSDMEMFEIPIRDFYGDVKDYLVDRYKYGGYDSLEYYGSFLETLKEIKDCLYVSFPDFPDSRKVDQNINEYFNDYI